jgi:hypothetical protein
LPSPPKKVKVKRLETPPVTPATSRKRVAPDDSEHLVEQKPSKRLKTANGNGTSDQFASPNKKRLLEDEGFVMLDKQHDELDDEDNVIVID